MYRLSAGVLYTPEVVIFIFANGGIVCAVAKREEVERAVGRLQEMLEN